MGKRFKKDLQFYKFCAYGFLKNLKFFEPFIMLFFLEKGLSYFEIGILYSIREISVNIIEIPSGVLADSLGRRRIMVLSFSSYIAAFLVFNFSSYFPLFMAAMIFFSFGEAFRTGTHKAMIFDYLKINGWVDQKVYYYGNTRAFSQIGSAVSSAIAAIIIFYTGRLELVFLYSVIPYLLDLILMLSYPKELEGPTGKVVFKEMSVSIGKVFKDFINTAKNPFFIKTVANTSFPRGFHKALKDYLQPVIILFAASFPFFTDMEKDKRLSLLIGFFYTIIFILNAFVSKKSGKISEKFIKLCIPLNITLFLVFALGAVIGIAYNMELFLIAIIAFLVIYLIINFRIPVSVSYLSEIADDSIMATVLSTDSQSSSFALSVIALVIGYLSDRIGIGYGILFVSLFLIVISLFIKLPDSEGHDMKTL